MRQTGRELDGCAEVTEGSKLQDVFYECKVEFTVQFLGMSWDEAASLASRIPGALSLKDFLPQIKSGKMIVRMPAGIRLERPVRMS